MLLHVPHSSGRHTQATEPFRQSTAHRQKPIFPALAPLQQSHRASFRITKIRRRKLKEERKELRSEMMFLELTTTGHIVVFTIQHRVAHLRRIPPPVPTSPLPPHTHPSTSTTTRSTHPSQHVDCCVGGATLSVATLQETGQGNITFRFLVIQHQFALNFVRIPETVRIYAGFGLFGLQRVPLHTTRNHQVRLCGRRDGLTPDGVNWTLNERKEKKEAPVTGDQSANPSINMGAASQGTHGTQEKDHTTCCFCCSASCYFRD